MYRALLKDSTADIFVRDIIHKAANNGEINPSEFVYVSRYLLALLVLKYVQTPRLATCMTVDDVLMSKQVGGYSILCVTYGKTKGIVALRDEDITIFSGYISYLRPRFCLEQNVRNLMVKSSGIPITSTVKEMKRFARDISRSTETFCLNEERNKILEFLRESKLNNQQTAHYLNHIEHPDKFPMDFESWRQVIAATTEISKRIGVFFRSFPANSVVTPRCQKPSVSLNSVQWKSFVQEFPVTRDGKTPSRKEASFYVNLQSGVSAKQLKDKWIYRQHMDRSEYVAQLLAKRQHQLDVSEDALRKEFEKQNWKATPRMISYVRSRIGNIENYSQQSTPTPSAEGATKNMGSEKTPAQAHVTGGRSPDTMTLLGHHTQGDMANLDHLENVDNLIIDPDCPIHGHLHCLTQNTSEYDPNRYLSTVSDMETGASWSVSTSLKSSGVHDPSGSPADFKTNRSKKHRSPSGRVNLAESTDFTSGGVTPRPKHFKPTEEKTGVSKIQNKTRTTTSTSKAENKPINEATRVKINSKNTPNNKENDGEISRCVNREYNTTNCPQCGQKVYRSCLRKHLTTHDEKTRECRVCSKQFSSYEQLVYHAMTHKMFDASRCQGCKTAFSSPARLNKHLLINTGKSQYNCSSCKKKFKFGCELSKHMVTHGRFVCSFCKKKFIWISQLKNHAVVHSNKRPFKCNICRKSFKSRHVLLTHRRMHSGDKPFKCDTCGKQFIQMSNLIRHQFSHVPSL